MFCQWRNSQPQKLQKQTDLLFQDVGFQVEFPIARVKCPAFYRVWLSSEYEKRGQASW